MFNDQKQNRTIIGVAYWFPHQGNVSTAILFDYDGQRFENAEGSMSKLKAGEVAVWATERAIQIAGGVRRPVVVGTAVRAALPRSSGR